MKRKLALLLAGAMTVSSLPVNVFANNTLETVDLFTATPFNVGGTGAAGNVEIPGGTMNVPARTFFVAPGAGPAPSGSANHNDFDHWVEGRELVVRLGERMDIPADFTELSFDLILDNAVWAFNLEDSLSFNTIGSNLTRPNPTLNPLLVESDFPRGTSIGAGRDQLAINYTIRQNQANPGIATVTVTRQNILDSIAATGGPNRPGLTTQSAAIEGHINDILDAIEALDDVAIPATTANSIASITADIADANTAITQLNTLTALATTLAGITISVSGVSTPLVQIASAGGGLNTIPSVLAATPVTVAFADETAVLNFTGAVRTAVNSLTVTDVLIDQFGLTAGTLVADINGAIGPEATAGTILNALAAIESAAGTNSTWPTTTQLDTQVQGLQVALAALMAPYNNIINPLNTGTAVVGTNVAHAELAGVVSATGVVTPFISGEINDLSVLLTAFAGRTTTGENTSVLARDEVAAAIAFLDDIDLGAGAALLGDANVPGSVLNIAARINAATDNVAITNLETAFDDLLNPTIEAGAIDLWLREHDGFRIPIIARTLGTGNASVRIGNMQNITLNSGTRVFANTEQTAAGATTTFVANQPVFSDAATLTIGISENRANAIASHGAFELVAPSGFQFTNANSVQLFAEGGLTTGGFGLVGTPQILSNGSVLRIQYAGLSDARTAAGALAVTNVRLVSEVNNQREGDVSLSIRNFSQGGSTPIQSASIENQSFVVGTFSDLNVNMTALGNIPELINGRQGDVVGTGSNAVIEVNNDHRAARVRVEEAVAGAWWAQRSTTFTLPDGVNIVQAEFTNTRNIVDSSELENTTFRNTNRNEGNVRINGNTLTITGLTTSGGANTTNRAAFDMDLWLTIESGFTGDIELEMSNANRDRDNEVVVIASAISPIDVIADVTTVRVGYQFVPVGNFRIVETVPGALVAGEQVFVSISDDRHSDIQIASGFDWEITDGDLRVRNVRTGTNLNLWDNSNRNNVNLSFEVDRESSRPSEIEFSNVQIRMSNQVQANHDANYDLVVWGPAVAANFDGVRTENNREVDRNFFGEPGIRTEFITVAGAGQAEGALNQNVQITTDSNTIVIGDRTVTMDTAAFVSEESSSLMLPVRFVAEALGLTAENVIWDAATSTVTIDAGARIIQFQTNSDVMIINGAQVPMLNAAGQSVRSEVRDDRAFLPVRALSQALNVDIEWNAETSTATINPN